MKASAIFLTVLLFALNFIPCRDAAALSNAGQASVEVPGSHNDSDRHADDNCSPLCICSCCSLASMPTPSIVVENIIETAHPIRVSKYKDQLLDISLPIWQPPQL